MSSFAKEPRKASHSKLKYHIGWDGLTTRRESQAQLWATGAIPRRAVAVRSARVTRLKDPGAHAEFPPSRTRRLITNVRILEKKPSSLMVEANFVVYRFRRGEDVRQYVGRYRYHLQVQNKKLKIRSREAVLDRAELGSLGTVSFIL